MNSVLNRPYREQIIEAYHEFIDEKIAAGLDPYYVNFMFSHIPSRRIEIMRQQVERVHSILSRHIVRSRNSPVWKDLHPVFIGCPDYPVFKHNKDAGQMRVANEGTHYNVIAMVPPPLHPLIPRRVQNAVFGRQSRLTVPLDQHFVEKADFYRSDVLSRIHVTPIVHGTMADYILKAFKNGRIDADDIQIWN